MKARLMVTDLHSHVLPALDDGAQDVAEALAMLEIAERDGITTIVATPHAAMLAGKDVEREVETLTRAARDRGLSIAIAPGCEVRFDADLAEQYARGELITCNRTPWLLLELSLRADWSPYLRQGIYDLQVAGAWPILAHAERYPAVQRNPDILLELIAQGVLVQVNADSVTGPRSRRAAVTAERLLRRQMVHVIASDAHDTDYRPPKVSTALKRAGALVGSDYMDWLANVPNRVLRGETVTPCDPIEAHRSGLMERLFSRSRTPRS